MPNEVYETEGRYRIIFVTYVTWYVAVVLITTRGGRRNSGSSTIHVVFSGAASAAAAYVIIPTYIDCAKEEIIIFAGARHVLCVIVLGIHGHSGWPFVPMNC